MSSLPLSSTRALPLPKSLRPVSSTSAQGINYDDEPPDTFKDARKIIGIAQCPQCSNLLQSPVTLPCGNSLCMRCIPKLHVRQNITFPATPNRLQGFTCPFSSCRVDHAIGDCNKDVTLNKIMNAVRLELENAKEQTEICLKLQERESRHRPGIPTHNIEDRTKLHPSGRLITTNPRYNMNELPYESELEYSTVSLDGEYSDGMNSPILRRLKETIRSELDCQVCYGIFANPYITTCGHTFCRKCFDGVFNHSKLCPICRSPQTRSTGQKAAIAPSMLLGKILSGLYHETVELRTVSVKDEEVNDEEMKTPLFICTPSFPGMPTFLHIFEPRYRLMIRRVMETAERKFGMLLHNPTRASQGNLGSVGFYEYGTMLHIVNAHRLPNEHILIETIGVSRFRVLRYGTRDEYTIGRVEPIDDVSIPEEEALEARETLSKTPGNKNFDLSPDGSNTQSKNKKLFCQVTGERLSTMSTQALFELGANFVKRMREQSAPWLQTRVFQAYGTCPEDADLFPWWFASVLPISDMEKYELLSTESVRDRLKICAGWINEIENQRDNNSWGSNYGVF